MIKLSHYHWIDGTNRSKINDNAILTVMITTESTKKAKVMKYCKAIGKGRYYGDITTTNAQKQWQNDESMDYDVHMMWWWNQKIYYQSAKIMHNRYKSRQQNNTYNNIYHTSCIYYSSEATIIVMMTITETNNAHIR